MSDPLVECRAPHHGEWFRVNPDSNYRKEVALTRDDDGKLYLIADHMIAQVKRLAPDRIEHCIVFTAQNKDGKIFLWPVNVPVPDDHPAWQAMHKWICLEGIQ